MQSTREACLDYTEFEDEEVGCRKHGQIDGGRHNIVFEEVVDELHGIGVRCLLECRSTCVL